MITGMNNIVGYEAKWGAITGNMSDQTDLNTALNLHSVSSGITGVNLYRVGTTKLYLIYVADATAMAGAIGTLSNIRPNSVYSLPAYPQGISFNCRLRLGTDGAVTVVATNSSDSTPITTSNVMAQGWFIAS